MKVICIDATNRMGEATNYYLKEGETYTVKEYWDSCCHKGKIVPIPVYVLAETGRWGFFVDRFVPLSSIDETEFERNYNKELV